MVKGAYPVISMITDLSPLLFNPILWLILKPFIILSTHFMLKRSIFLLLTAVVSGLTVHYLHRLNDFQTVFLPNCSTPEPLRFEALIAAANVTAFVWGYGREPVHLKVWHGPSLVHDVQLIPDENGKMLWSESGDWYDDFVVELNGKACRMNVTVKI